VSAIDQRWIESTLMALTWQFRITVAERPTVVAHTGFYPLEYATHVLMHEELARKLCGVMNVGSESVRVRLVGGAEEQTARTAAADTPYAGHFDERAYDADTGLSTIDLDRDLSFEPALLTAVIAHELGHVLLRGKAARLEERVDLLAIAFGLGLFGANVKFQQHPDRLLGQPTSLGGLSPQKYGYALACAAWMRDEREPQWAASVSMPVRGYLDRGLLYLSRHAGGGGLPTVTAPSA
jgi:hypothetical protein